MSEVNDKEKKPTPDKRKWASLTTAWGPEGVPGYRRFASKDAKGDRPRWKRNRSISPLRVVFLGFCIWVVNRLSIQSG